MSRQVHPRPCTQAKQVLEGYNRQRHTKTPLKSINGLEWNTRLHNIATSPTLLLSLLWQSGLYTQRAIRIDVLDVDGSRIVGTGASLPRQSRYS